MRNAVGIAVAAALLGSIPAAAQMRRAPAQDHVRPARSVSHAARFPQARPAPARVRVVFARPAPSQRQPIESGSTTAPPIGVSATPQPSNAAFAPTGGTPIPLGQLLNPVPGLGFDYNHLAAINGGLAVRAIIDPVTQHELSTVESLPEQAPVGFGYFPAYAGYVGQGPADVGARQPQVIVVQQPVAETARAASPAAVAPVAPAAATPPPPPLPVGVLYLVRRSGAVIHAIAFSQHDGQVIYISADGLRHSVALSELNIPATEHRNAQHGTVVHLIG